MTTLFHVTPKNNWESIEKEAVRPDLSLGRRQVSYWVTSGNVEWALAHVSFRHNLNVQGLCVVVGDIPAIDLIRTSRRGVWCTRKPVSAIAIVPSASFLAEVVTAWEAEDDAQLGV